MNLQKQANGTLMAIKAAEHASNNPAVRQECLEAELERFFDNLAEEVDAGVTATQRLKVEIDISFDLFLALGKTWLAKNQNPLREVFFQRLEEDFGIQRNRVGFQEQFSLEPAWCFWRIHLDLRQLH